MLFSVTDLCSYSWCPRGLYLKKVMKIREPPKDALVLGTIRHAAYDGISGVEEQLAKQVSKGSTLETVKSSFVVEYQKILSEAVISNTSKLQELNLNAESVFVNMWPHLQIEAEDRSSKILQFAQTNNVFEEELWKNLTPKFLSELRVESPNLGLKGIVDRIAVENSSYIPIELKTGRTPLEGVWPSHRIQIGAYSMMLSEKFDTDIPFGIINYLDTRIERSVFINPFLEIEVKGLRDKVEKLISGNLPEKCSAKKKCGTCKLFDTTQKTLLN